MRNKIVKKAGRNFSIEDQHKIIQEMISNGCTKRAIWKKYTGQDEEKGQLFRWMKKLGYSSYRPRKMVKLDDKNLAMPRKEKSNPMANLADQNTEILQMGRLSCPKISLHIFQLNKCRKINIKKNNHPLVY